MQNKNIKSIKEIQRIMLEKKILELYKEGLSSEQISEFTGKPLEEIFTLIASEPGPPPQPADSKWTEEEIEILHKLYPYQFIKEIMKLLPHRSRDSIRRKAKSLKLERQWFNRVCTSCKKNFQTLRPNRLLCLTCRGVPGKDEKEEYKKIKTRAYEVLGFDCYYRKDFSCCANSKDIRILHLFGKKHKMPQLTHKWIIEHPEEARKEYCLICFNARAIMKKQMRMRESVDERIENEMLL